MENLYIKLSQNRRLETERLLLRPVTLDDAESMFAYASDEENTRYVFLTNQSLQETRNNIAAIYLASPLGRWGIELKGNGKFIGTIDLHKVDAELKKAAIGYVINKTYWNQGLATEANRAVIRLAFEKLGMNKLVAVHDRDNPASGRVMEKSGMRFSHEEPYAKLDKHREGRIVTRCHYVLTKEEYERPE
ncbi:GNAT family N-acetyltransferase [Streptococcus panodentis]|uniref:N-acetyltransferase n=1 Tax=Streptococcus panodentis TaxID=1581472 RepID=A0ABS5AYZ5_9STRE|nr:MULTISPECIES: GNAT family N-acetyltransferase [Streptococcus]KXT82501.1 Acetyltransferase, GNAT family [Streptococcus sp. DD11]MBP2621651.1 N-acetyltransferase [Streptococcus panodentis]